MNLFHISSKSAIIISCVVLCGFPLPFGGDVLLHIGEGTKAMVLEEGAAVFVHKVVDGLTPPAGVTETGEL